MHELFCTALGGRSGPPSSSVQIVQEAYDSCGALFMNRVADLVAVAVESNPGGYIEHLLARNAEGVIGQGDPQAFVRRLRRLLRLLGVYRQENL